MKTLKSEEAITILEDMKVNISIPRAAVTQIKRNVALNMAIDALLRCSEIPNDSDTISRQAAIDALEAKKDKSANGDIGCFYNTIIQNNIDALKGLPSAQPERKTGRWIDDNCSECGQYVFHGDVRNFCPNCGAKMLKNDEVYANEWLGL